MNNRRVLAFLAAVALGIGLIGVSGAAVAAPVQQGYYVSLGDSLAFGYQPDLVAAGDLNAADYRSYAEDFAAMRPHLALVNYGCPGETTATFVNGGCRWPGTLHDSYDGAPSQLAAAENFLAAHPGSVSLITVDIGSNDLNNLVNSCRTAADPTACIVAKLPATLGALATNYGSALAHLTALAPTARLVLFNIYNPLALSLPASDALIGAVNTVISQLAATFHASVADAYTAINHEAGSPAEPAFVCSRTWECTTYKNIHPTDLGYRALTIALLHALA